MQFIKSISGFFTVIFFAALVYGLTIASIPIMFCATLGYLLSLSWYLESRAIIIKETEAKETQEKKEKEKEEEKKEKAADLKNKEQRGEIPTIEELSLGPDISKDDKLYSSELVIYKYQNITFHVVRILNMQEENSSLILISSKQFETLQKNVNDFHSNPLQDEVKNVFIQLWKAFSQNNFELDNFELEYNKLNPLDTLADKVMLQQIKETFMLQREIYMDPNIASEGVAEEFVQ